jgi:hypothetical protein
MEKILSPFLTIVLASTGSLKNGKLISIHPSSFGSLRATASPIGNFSAGFSVDPVFVPWVGTSMLEAGPVVSEIGSIGFTPALSPFMSHKNIPHRETIKTINAARIAASKRLMILLSIESTSFIFLKKILGSDYNFFG